jgi:hypothetical protein
MSYGPFHTQHHEGDDQKDCDSHRALRELVDLSPDLIRSGRSFPVRPAVEAVGRSGERATSAHVCYGLGLPDRYNR